MTSPDHIKGKIVEIIITIFIGIVKPFILSILFYLELNQTSSIHLLFQVMENEE